MRNFFKIGEINPKPLLLSILKQPNLWDSNTIRTSHKGSAHKDASDILIRFNDLEKSINILNDLDNIYYPAFALLPQIRPLIFDLMRFVEGERLGRVVITRLPVGGRILPHKDEGKSAEYYKRYHIFLQNYEGAEFRCGNEIICPNAGDIYWFNNLIEHEIVNNSIDDRITLIIDIK